MKTVKAQLRFLLTFVTTFFLAAVPVFAQVPSIPSFQASQAVTDVSIAYLGNIFGIVGTVLQGSGTQIVGQMFSEFNAGVLTLAGIVLMYTLVVATLATAHEGEVLGKKWQNSIWIPLRSAIGIALLAPGTSGYSALQVFIMWIAIQGVGLANLVWGKALDYLNTGGVIISQNISPSHVSQAMIQPFSDIFTSLVCMYALQDALNGESAAQGNPLPPPLPSTVIPFDLTNTGATAPSIPLPGNVTGYQVSGICGTLSASLPPNSVGSNTQYQQYVVLGNALAQSITGLSTYAQLVETNSESATPIPLSVLLPQSIFYDAAVTYQGLSASIFNQSTQQSSVQLQKSINTMKQEGWITAGQYFYIISNITHGLSNPSTPPAVTPPIDPSALQSALQNVFGSDYSTYGTPVISVINSLSAPDSSIPPMALPPGGSGFIAYALNYLSMIQQVQGAYGTVPPTSSSCKSGGGLNGFAQFQCIITNYAGDVASPVNPIIRISNLGVTLINIVMIVWITLGVAMFLAAVADAAVPLMALGTAPNALAAIIAPFLSLLMTAIVVPGAIMAYYIPMIPFIIFTFTAIGWFVAVIEAMAGAPIIALGILYPDGQHELVGRAEPAINIIINLFLRPALIIFGYIMGIILCYVSMWLLNRGLAAVVYGIKNASGTNYGGMSGWIWSIAIIVIYAAISMAIVNRAFSLTPQIADRIMRFLGSAEERYGGTEALEETKSAIGGMGRIGGEMGNAAEKAASGTWQAAQQRGRQEQEKQERLRKEQAAIDAQQRGGGGGAGGGIE